MKSLLIIEELEVIINKMSKLLDGYECYLGGEDNWSSRKKINGLNGEWRALAESLPEIDGCKIESLLYSFSDIDESRMDYYDIGVRDQTNNDILIPFNQLRSYKESLGRFRIKIFRSVIDQIIDNIDGVVKDVDASQGDANSEETSRLIEGMLLDLTRLLGPCFDSQRIVDPLGTVGTFEGNSGPEYYNKIWPLYKDSIRLFLAGKTKIILDEGDSAGFVYKDESRLRGNVDIRFEHLGPGEFEKLIYEFFKNDPEFFNVDYKTDVNAPDGGVDISMERRVRYPGRSFVVSKVAVQVKHVKGGLSARDIEGAVNDVKRDFNELIIVTSGSFTKDGVERVKKIENGSDGLRMMTYSGDELKSAILHSPSASTLMSKYRLFRDNL